MRKEMLVRGTLLRTILFLAAYLNHCSVSKNRMGLFIMPNRSLSQIPLSAIIKVFFAPILKSQTRFLHHFYLFHQTRSHHSDVSNEKDRHIIGIFCTMMCLS